MTATAAGKLGVKSGMSLTVVGMPAEEALSLLGALPEGAQVVEGQADIVLFFAADRAAVRAGARDAHDLVSPSGRLWIAYRKGASRRGAAAEDMLHRDTLQDELHGLGLTGVSLIALDDQWSAMRVRPRKDGE